MKQRPRIYYTESQKALMWDRWKRGDSLQTIAQLFERNHSSIQRILAETGGIRPAQRCRSARALAVRARGNIAGGRQWRVNPCGCEASSALAINGQQGNQTQWWARSLPCGASGSACLGSGASPQTL